MNNNIFTVAKEYLIANGFKERIIYGKPQNRFQKYFNSSLKGYSYIEFDFNKIDDDDFFHIIVSLSFSDQQIINELQKILDEGNIYKKEVLRLIELERK